MRTQFMDHPRLKYAVLFSLSFCLLRCLLSPDSCAGSRSVLTLRTLCRTRTGSLFATSLASTVRAQFRSLQSLLFLIYRGAHPHSPARDAGRGGRQQERQGLHVPPPQRAKDHAPGAPSTRINLRNVDDSCSLFFADQLRPHVSAGRFADLRAHDAVAGLGHQGSLSLLLLRLCLSPFRSLVAEAIGDQVAHCSLVPAARSLTLFICLVHFPAPRPT